MTPLEDDGPDETATSSAQDETTAAAAAPESATPDGISGATVAADGPDTETAPSETGRGAAPAAAARPRSSTPRRPKDPDAPPRSATSSATAARRAAKATGTGTGTPRTRQSTPRTRTRPAASAVAGGDAAGSDPTGSDPTGSDPTGNAAVEVSRPVASRSRATKATSAGTARPARSTTARASSTRTRTRPATSPPASETAAAAAEEDTTGTAAVASDSAVEAPSEALSAESVAFPSVVPSELPEPPQYDPTPPMVDAVVAAALDELRAAARRPRHGAAVPDAPDPAPSVDGAPAALLPDEPRDYTASVDDDHDDHDEQAAAAAAAFDASRVLADLPTPPPTPLSVVPPLAYRLDDEPATTTFPAVGEEDPASASVPTDLRAVPPLAARPGSWLPAAPAAEPEPEPAFERWQDEAPADVVPAAALPEPAADVVEEEVAPAELPAPATETIEPIEEPAAPDVLDLTDATTALPAVEADLEVSPAREVPVQERPVRGPRPAPAPATRRPTSPQRATTARAPRRARLVVRTVSPWSVLKVTAVVSGILVVIGMIATSILYVVLNGAGVFGSIAKFIDTLTDSGPGTKNASSRGDFSALIVIGGSTLLLLINAILFTVFATLGAFVYNLCASFVGGLELTLTERE